jgi:eukaryotic-like serine/threonine-protein kinase
MTHPDATLLIDAPPLASSPAGDDVQIGPLERAKARVGHAIRGKWRLDALLGAGGTAAVYAATHRNRSRVAIKMLHPELSAQPSVRGSFLREGYAANGVPHDGVVHVIDDDVAEDGAAFIVMELLEGQTLRDRLDQSTGPLAMDEACKITDKVLDILAAAHAQGIQHRDVTPKNVFIMRDGRIKLIDFGSAFIAELSQQSGGTLNVTPMGTPPYMSPELARGRFADVDPRTDVFSAGALLYTMLTGKAPRHAETVNEELLAAMTEPLPSIATARAELPKCIVELVDRAVSFEKTDRWPGARAMQDALILAREGISSTPEAVAEVVGVESSSAGNNDMWNANDATQQAVSPYGAELVPHAPVHAMNPLFVGSEGSVAPVARQLPQPHVRSYAPPRSGMSIATVLVVALLVFGALASVALLVVDRNLLPGHAQQAKVAALAATPPRAEDPIPPPPAADPTPAPSDPTPAVPAAKADAPAAKADAPAPPPPSTATAVVVAPPPAAPAKGGARPAARRPAPAPTADPLVRANPFDN